MAEKTDKREKANTGAAEAREAIGVTRTTCVVVGGGPGGAVLALLLTLGLRAAVTWRAREPWWTVPLHPLTVLVALAIQWTALARWAVGLPPGWKGRAYPGTKAA